MAATAINKRVWMDASKGAILPIAIPDARSR